MKKTLFLFLFFSSSIFGQQRTISVEYKTELFEQETEIPDEFLKNMYKDALSNSKLVRFNLLIHDNVAKFYDLPCLSISNNNAKNFMLAWMGYTGIIYTKKDSVYSESMFLDSNKLVKNTLLTNWTITSETKKIDNYLCFKATTIFEVDNGVKKNIVPVTAWFCPSLPYSFGPVGYGGLPGLILELQVRKSWFAVSKIDFDSKVTFKEEEFSKKKKISVEELNIQIKKTTDEMFKD